MLNPDGDVMFVTASSVDGEYEGIEIAKDWENGQRLYEEGKPHEAMGFIGKGYTKQGIYVSCHGHELNNSQDVEFLPRQDSVAGSMC